MGNPKRLAAALLALALGIGCSSVVWTVEKSLRDPGERLDAFPEEVWEEYRCGQKKLPFFEIEENELVPPRIKPGGEFNHRLVYVMCPVRPTAVLRGTLNTRILFRGETIVRESVSDYELKPGRWVVDSFVTLPPEVDPGIYALEVEFRNRRVRFDERLTFAVDPS